MGRTTAGALLYLRLATAAGWLTSRVRRLKQPKYLVGAVVGVAYLYSFLFRNLPQSRIPQTPGAAATPPETLAIVPDIAAAALLVVIALNWIVPRGRAGLTFSEAEISFLFTAPVRRGTLIHYRLLSALGGMALTAFFLTLVFGRGMGSGGAAWLRGIGWWTMLGTINLHFTATSFVVTRLLDRGVSSLARGAAGVVVLVLAIGLPLVWTLTALPAPTQQDLAGVAPLMRYLEAALESGPLPWLLAVPKLVTAPLFAADVRAFALALGPALAVLAAHYAWVLVSAVSFEEASIAKAEKRATRLAAFRSGNLRTTTIKRLRDPFRLRDTGPPEIAFLWKNLLAMGRVCTPRSALAAAAILAAGSLWLSSTGLRGGQAALGVAGVAVLLIVVLIGPQFARQDLRSDLKNVDILKTYPLAGAQIVFGELLAPIAALSVIAWLALLAVTLSPVAANVPAIAKAGGVLALAVGTPFVCALQLVVHNAIALTFPAWMQSVSNHGEHGLDVLGHRIVFLAGQILLFLLGLLPAALGAAVTFFVVVWLAGPVVAALLASLASLTVLGFEIWGGVRWLGARFALLDLSAELQP